MPRTSALKAPLMELSGHTGEIFAAKFDPTGNLIASGSMDRTISAPPTSDPSGSGGGMSPLTREMQCSGERTATAKTTAS